MRLVRMEGNDMMRLKLPTTVLDKAKRDAAFQAVEAIDAGRRALRAGCRPTVAHAAVLPSVELARRLMKRGTR